MSKKLFCEINPTCYAISVQKEIFLRHIKDLFSKEKLATTKTSKKLPVVVYRHKSELIKRTPDADLTLQENKAVNIELAASKINGIVIEPGETFSFWKAVGKTSKRKGYKEGRLIQNSKLVPGVGGGLCNLGNTVHLLVLHTPLKVTEFHKHSDSLSPDNGKRTPLSAGTSVSYNNLDFRFKNNTNQRVQVLCWCENGTLHAELRSEKQFPCEYNLVEENSHYKKEGNKYFRISKIYREIIDKISGKTIKKELILDNHSEVFYDYSLIPKNEIRK